MLDQSDPDSGLNTEVWNSRKLSRPKVKYIVKSCMLFIPLAGKSYKLEYNSRKISRKVLVID